MKLIPKNLFKSKKKRSISRSENTSFGSVTTTTSSDSITTPTSVLPQIPSELIHVYQMIGDNAKIQKEDELSGNTSTNMLPEISSELIHVFQMIGTNTNTHKEEISVNTPTKIPSELIHVFQMIGTNTNTQMEGISVNTDSVNTPTEISSELIHAYQMIGDNAKIQEDELSGNMPTNMLPEIPSELIHAFNGDGCISLQELQDTFDFFDINHDGKITAEELFNVFSTIGDERCTLEECKRMIRVVDKNGDGFVCFEDFCIMMEQQKMID